MKDWLTAFSMCQSMFCAIPFPIHEWKEECRGRMLQCLPLVGVELGVVWWLVELLCRRAGLPVLLRGAAVAFCPYLTTGFMHLDGFMDVTDAVRSYRSLERRREILKDSHVGSFAVIAVAMLLIGQFAGAADMTGDASALLLIPAVTRACAVLAVLGLPPMKTSQYAETKRSRKALAVPAAVLAVLLAAGIALWGRRGLSLAAAAAGYGLALRRGYKSLEGMNGDISGYALCLGELAGIVTLAVL